MFCRRFRSPLALHYVCAFVLFGQRGWGQQATVRLIVTAVSSGAMVRSRCKSTEVALLIRLLPKGSGARKSLDHGPVGFAEGEPAVFLAIPQIDWRRCENGLVAFRKQTSIEILPAAEQAMYWDGTSSRRSAHAEQGSACVYFPMIDFALARWPEGVATQELQQPPSR